MISLDDLKKILQFYADPQTYNSPSTGFAAQYDPEPAPIEKDNGLRARLVLQSLTPDLVIQRQK